MGWMVGRMGGMDGWMEIRGSLGAGGCAGEAGCVGVSREHWKASRGGLKSDRGV